LAACQENAAAGPVVVPDHVLVRQTVDDCLHEGLSVEGLVDLWAKVESGAVAVHTVESSEPSPLSHGILSGRPFTFLDGAPLEERRTRALSLRRGLGALGPNGLPVPADELDALDPAAVAVVLEQLRPSLRSPDELHDLLLSLVACRPVPEWTTWFEALVADGRALVVDGCWAATEQREAAAALTAGPR
jgi:ATP-dependent Lhr-like helicase